MSPSCDAESMVFILTRACRLFSRSRLQVSCQLDLGSSSSNLFCSTLASSAQMHAPITATATTFRLTLTTMATKNDADGWKRRVSHLDAADDERSSADGNNSLCHLNHPPLLYYMVIATWLTNFIMVDLTASIFSTLPPVPSATTDQPKGQHQKTESLSSLMVAPKQATRLL